MADPDTLLCNTICFQVLALPHKSDNQLLDPLPFSVESHALCTKPELRIVEGDNCCLAVV